MSYEQFRSAYAARLMGRFPPELLHDALQELDFVSSDFHIERACTDLILAGEDVPEVVHIYIASLAVEGTAKSTMNGYLGILRRFFSIVRKPYARVTTNDIRIYLYSYQHNGEKELKKSSVEHVRVVINAFFEWLVNEEYLERNPARKISPIHYVPAEREPMSQIELEYMRRACVTFREKALVDFLYATGCRISECAAVDVKDIDFLDRSVRIRHGKGDKPRIVYFNAESQVSLMDYLSNRGFDSPVLFAKSRAPHGRISSRALQQEIRKIYERAREKISVPVTPHVFRHTFATSALANGMPVEQVQQLLGHASLDTTMIYAKVDQQDVKSSHRKYVS